VTLLAARGITRRFGKRVALQPMDVELVPGEVVALIGPNGAGKSTLLSILAGALAPTHGVVERPARVGWVPQRPAHYGRLTARENLRLFASLERVPPERGDELALQFELPEGTRASALSVGNRQRLDVALALLADPQVLLLDEPTASLDPVQRARVWEIARGVADRGGAVLVATHHWEELEGKADRSLELVEGRLA
jgi:ABC-type multidrug transport system ATPase subunit